LDDEGVHLQKKAGQRRLGWTTDSTKNSWMEIKSARASGLRERTGCAARINPDAGLVQAGDSGDDR
jgi:hypothetical protein